ncbi:Terpene synthase, metal-binding domain-containing protein, partial [Cynara cardunculus var. scolymus]
MVVSLSSRGPRLWVVDCCRDHRRNPLVFRISSSHAAQAKPNVQTLDMTKERIKKLLSNVELSVSSYDTAWVAMVPSPNSPNSPCFPQCLNWVMDNQLKDATDENQPSPIGFDISFPHMLEYAKELNISLPLNQTDLSVMIHQRELELRRCCSRQKEAYLAYISEGLGNYHDWNMVKTYQMKNGSLFNSPSATAAALIHHQNAGCLDYLTSLVNKFGNADPLTESTKRGDYMNLLEEPFKDIHAALEVYHASQIMHQEELSSIPSNSLNKFIHKQVGVTLKFPFNAGLERMSTRRNIEHYKVEDARILKTTYRSPNISNEDYIRLAVEDYNACQSIYREELKGLERWVVENRLDKLKFARQKTAYCYFSAASTLPSPELSDARISWAKNSILVGMIDDFFDVGGSMDELLNLIQSVEKYIILIYTSMLREAIWTIDGRVPTINEYMENGYVSLALGPIVLPVLYFIGPRLSEEIVRSSEYHKLFKLMSTEGRLLNDIRGYKRELKAGKLNAVTLHMRHAKCGLVEEKVVEEIKILIEDQRRELMRLVLQTKGSIVPKACKDTFWNMSNVLNLFYAKNDGFTRNDILDIVQQIIYEPVS